MSKRKMLFTRRRFLRDASTTLFSIGAITAGCTRTSAPPDHSTQGEQGNISDPSTWWQKEGFIVHDRVDISQHSQGIIRAYVNDSWQNFRVAKLPERFVQWSLRARVARLGRMLKVGGMDPRDLAGAHNACVATYGGPSRDSAISLNTAYKGMGFVIEADKLADTVQRIKEEQFRIERDTRGDVARQMHAKVEFLIEFYHDGSHFDLTKQVSLELFTSQDFQTHTFLNMMANPIASASFLAFPTFEIRTVPQLLHPRNPGLSGYEKDLISYTNAIHDFIHSGPGDRITCVYHIIELFDDTPNDMAKGRRIV
ncbi:MAG: hypothetical protein ACMUJM_18440 [bacterium]